MGLGCVWVGLRMFRGDWDGFGVGLTVVILLLVTCREAMTITIHIFTK